MPEKTPKEKIDEILNVIQRIDFLLGTEENVVVLDKQTKIEYTVNQKTKIKDKRKSLTTELVKLVKKL